MGRFGRMTFGVAVSTALLGGLGAAVPMAALTAGSPALAATAIEYGLSAHAGGHAIVCNPTAVEYGGTASCG
jgi:hypothetical protein